MRKALFLAAALSFAAPAAAQPSAADQAQEALEQVDFDRTATMLERMVDVFLDIPVGGIAAAVDPLGHRTGIYPHDTVGSVTNRNDPGAAQRLRGQIRGAARTAERATRAVARMMPELERSFEQLRAGFAAAIESARDE